MRRWPRVLRAASRRGWPRRSRPSSRPALRAIAILDTERTVVTLSGKGGTPLAEVADNLVTATRLDQAGAEPLRWREIEVEAASEDSAAASTLRAAGQALLKAGARRSASASKLGRLLGTG